MRASGASSGAVAVAVAVTTPSRRVLVGSEVRGTDGPAQFLEELRRDVAEGPRPRQVLLTLLADYWLAPGAAVPSGALVELAADFGISEAGARTVLTRLARDGRVSVSRLGRQTFYELTPWMRRRLGVGLERMRTFGREEEQVERWTCVAFSVPEEQRAVRHKLRTGLQWLGFAPWYDGLWISPRASGAAVGALISSLDVEAASVFEADLKAVAPAYGQPVDAWDLGAIRAVYERFLDEVDPVLAHLGDEDPGGVGALVRRTQLVNVWRLVPGLDPGLPVDVLPADWPRERARVAFEELYSRLAPAALRRVRAAVSTRAPERASDAEVHYLGIGLSGA